MRHVDCTGARWRKAYKANGVLVLDDTRRNNSGHSRQREITKEEIIVKQNAKIEYLKAEVELLKKIRAARKAGEKR